MPERDLNLYHRGIN